MASPKLDTKLSAREAAVARRLIREEGAEKAAKLMGLHDARTARKLAVGERAHPLSVSVARTNLARVI